MCQSLFTFTNSSIEFVTNIYKKITNYTFQLESMIKKQKISCDEFC